MRDEIIAELRRTREEIAERFNYDVKKIFEYYRERQKEREAKVPTGDGESIDTAAESKGPE